MVLRGKNVLVIGLARTGSECASFLTQRGANVVVSDLRREEELETARGALAGLASPADRHACSGHLPAASPV